MERFSHGPWTESEQCTKSLETGDSTLQATDYSIKKLPFDPGRRAFLQLAALLPVVTIAASRAPNPSEEGEQIQKPLNIEHERKLERRRISRRRFLSLPDYDSTKKKPETSLKKPISQSIKDFFRPVIEKLPRTLLETGAISTGDAAILVRDAKRETPGSLRDPMEQLMVLHKSSLRWREKLVRGAKVVLTEEAAYRIFPSLITDFLTYRRPPKAAPTEELVSAGRVLRNHWIGEKYNDENTSLGWNIAAGTVFSLLWGTGHRGSALRKAYLSAVGGYQYFITGGRNILHGIISHGVHNTMSSVITEAIIKHKASKDELNF